MTTTVALWHVGATVRNRATNRTATIEQLAERPPQRIRIRYHHNQHATRIWPCSLHHYRLERNAMSPYRTDIYPPGTPDPRLTTIGLICPNPVCPDHLIVHDVPTTVEFGIAFLQDDNDAWCGRCAWAREDPLDLPIP